jgi:hypothetical protein
VSAIEGSAGFSGTAESKLEVDGVEQGPSEEEVQQMFKMAVPLVPLVNVHVDVEVDGAGNKCLMVGPIMLVAPLTDEGAAEIASSLTKRSILTAPASALAEIAANVPAPMNREQKRAAAKRG